MYYIPRAAVCQEFHRDFLYGIGISMSKADACIQKTHTTRFVVSRIFAREAFVKMQDFP